MSEELIKYFLDWDLGWLIPCEYENEVEQIKKEMGL